MMVSAYCYHNPDVNVLCCHHCLSGQSSQSAFPPTSIVDDHDIPSDASGTSYFTTSFPFLPFGADIGVGTPPIAQYIQHTTLPPHIPSAQETMYPATQRLSEQASMYGDTRTAQQIGFNDGSIGWSRSPQDAPTTPPAVLPSSSSYPASGPQRTLKKSTIATSQVRANSQRRRTSVPQFQCPICSELLTSKQNCKSHVRSHYGEKPFECPKCKKPFGRPYDCKRHFKTYCKASNEATS